MKTEWVTIKQVKQAAKENETALDLSKLHWRQLYRANAKELREAIARGKVSIGVGFCALCEKYRAGVCSGCPIKAESGFAFCANTPYRGAVDALTKWQYSGGNWRIWKEACEKQLKFMESL